MAFCLTTLAVTLKHALQMVAEHTTGMVGSLPTELWISIVNHCQCSTLAALCQVSRLLYTVTLPRLYLDPFNSQFAYRRVQLEQSLAQHDHLAELVRTYRARPHQTTPAEILKKMTGLTHVSIRGRVPFLDFIQGYPPSNIRRLDLDVRIDTMDHQTAQIIAEWLATQREIVWLRWISRFEDTKQLSFLGAGLPKLRTLCTEASLAEFFLPGRSVSEFSCGCRSLAAEDIVTIAPLFTKDLRKLRLTLHQGALEMAMASLSNTCSKLTELHIQLGDHMTLVSANILYAILIVNESFIKLATSPNSLPALERVPFLGTGGYEELQRSIDATG